MAARRLRTAVLVLRVWTSDGEALRARIVTSEDVTRGGERSVAATEVDDICAIIRGWLEPLARQAGTPTGGH